ncbi:MAG: hypothetical protein WC506_01220 [Candidatus Micrarchaeia archaeon]
MLEKAKKIANEMLDQITWPHISRFILLVMVPFLIGAVLLQHEQMMKGDYLKITNENQTKITDSMVYTTMNGGGGLQQISTVSSLFPLAAYLDFPPFVMHNNPQVCFADNGSVLMVANNTTISPAIEWTVEIDSSHQLHFNSSAVSCHPFDLAKGNNYVWRAKIDTNVTYNELGPDVVFIPSVVAYPESQMNYGVLQGIALIPVFYLLIWYPVFGIIKKIREGMEAQ